MGGQRMALTKNSVWKIAGLERIDNGLYRVLSIFQDIDAVVLFSLDQTRPVKPVLTKLSSLNRTIKVGTTTKADFPLPFYMQVDEQSIPHKLKSKRDKNFQIIEGIVKDKGFLFEYCISKRSDLLVKYAQNIGEYRNKVDRLLQQYWKFGQDKNALLPAYANSGGAGKERKATVPLGAPKRTRTLAVVRSRKYILTTKDKEQIKKSLKAHYLKEDGDSLVDTYKKYLRKYFADEVKISEAIGKSPYAPSLRQFAYWKSKLISKDIEIQTRTSVRDYLLNKRGTLGSATERSPVPGDVFEIDATVADVHIVSAFSSQRVLGRPTIYSIIDRATRMIVGFHVSLYYASWRAARQALVNCFLPKKAYCSQYGINISEAEWPCHHIPEELVCDNGEMIGLKPEEHLVPFTQLSFAPPYRPDRKSFVERRFDILNKKAIHPLLGATRKGKVVRGEVDPRKLAIHTLHEVTQLLIEAVLEHNRDILKRLAFENPLLIENDLAPTPINCWKVNVESQRHSLIEANHDEVISRLLPPETVSMTGDGILYNGMYFTCKRILEEDLASIARTKGWRKLEARVDENCSNYIYVRFGDREPFVKCNLSPKSRMFRDLPIVESDFVLDWTDEKSEQSPVTAESIDMQYRTDALKKQAKDRAKENSTHRNNRAKGIQKNRKEELELMNGKDTTQVSKSVKDNDIVENKNVVTLPRRNKRAQDV